MDHPIICFGQQPCGFFPKRFLFAKIITARRLQKEIGGEIVFFLFATTNIGYLWYNFIGCAAVLILAPLLQQTIFRATEAPAGL